ncbi:MAG: hypothetical protein AAF647_06820, partial [Pseudomonadota bacterium]
DDRRAAGNAPAQVFGKGHGRSVIGLWWGETPPYGPLAMEMGLHARGWQGTRAGFWEGAWGAR